MLVVDKFDTLVPLVAFNLLFSTK